MHVLFKRYDMPEQEYSDIIEDLYVCVRVCVLKWIQRDGLGWWGKERKAKLRNRRNRNEIESKRRKLSVARRDSSIGW